MSLILDALRKIEQERRTRRQGAMDIRADVLNYHGRTPPPPKNRLLPLVGLALIASIAAALFFFFKQGSPPIAGELTAPVTAVDSPAAVPAVLPAPAGEPAPLPKAAEVLPAQAPQRATAALSGDETMVISGIAWQEERGMRRAVVNGVLAAEGAEILGTRIVEIREDRVLFSRNGSNFEVLYTGGAGR